MWPEPDDPAATRRMRVAHSHAQKILQSPAGPNDRSAWGWQGRTLGMPVATAHGRGWLRVACAPTDQIIDTFWTGAADAQRLLPSAIPRPRLHRCYDWSDDNWAYRAELYEHVSVDPIAPHAVITAAPTLSAAWWSHARTALAAVATVDTERVTIQPGFLAWAMPHHLGVPFGEFARSPWTTAHGDFHFANLCAPDLRILDWEGWGLAPQAYDAAMLHSYCLLVPNSASEVRREMAHLLDCETGRFAELVSITELLDATTQGVNQALAAPLRQRAASILELNEVAMR